MKKILLAIFSMALLMSLEVQAQNRVLSGTVIGSSDGQPIPGVNVRNTATNTGTVTDLDGKYSINVTNETVIEFSFVGYVSQQFTVGNQTTLNVTLEEDLADLSEVVVTALGIAKEKRSLAYSVTEVGGEDLIEAREISLGDQIQGRVAGVNVSNIGSGVAGSSRIVIRGNSSLSGQNQPLFVIDGVPMDNSQLGSAGMWGGVDWGDGLTSINPDDIESMSVLKGNTAAALYGSRASNGVVLITTKKGVNRKGIGVEVNSQFTADRIINRFDFQEEYGHGNAGLKPANAGQGFLYGSSAWGGKLDGSMVYQFDGEQRPYVYAGDNFDRYYRTGTTWTNTIALSGGNDKQTFRFSMSDLRNQSITPNSGMNRQTATLSTNANYIEKLTLSAKVQYSREDVTNRARLSDAPGNGNATLSVLPPSINVNDLKGDPNKLGARPDGYELQYVDNTFTQNPWWAAYQFENSNIRDRVIASAMARYDFTDWLYLQGRIGSDFYTSRRRSLEPYGTAYIQLGALNEEEHRVREINMDWMLGSDHKWGDFGISAFVGGSTMTNKYEVLGGRATNFNVPFLHTLPNGGQQSIVYNISEFGINSLYGSAEFSYKDLLFINATARNDWYSTLPPDSNDLLFPSVGASFVFSEAFELPDWISFGKVRASMAGAGGGTDPYQLILNYSLFGQGHNGSALGRIDQTSVPNSQLKPLRTNEFELGVDIRFFEDRLGIDYAYYNRETRDDIIQATISQTSGYGNATVNVGKVSNSGHEVLLTGSILESSQLRWNTSLNFSYNKNDVEQLFGDSKVLSVESPRGGGANIQHRIPYTDEETGMYMEGGYGVIVGLKHMTIDGQKVYDANGLPVQESGAFYLGRGVAPWSGGWNNNFAFNNFTLGFLVDFKFGGSLFSGTNANSYSNGMHKATLEGRENGLTISGVDENGDPQTWEIAASDPNNQGITTVQNYYSQLASISEYFVYSADYIKLRQVSLGYVFPSSLLRDTPFTGVSLSLIGRNLWLIHSEVDNIDPESTYSSSNGQGLEWYGVPQTRSYGFNLSVKF